MDDHRLIVASEGHEQSRLYCVTLQITSTATVNTSVHFLKAVCNCGRYFLQYLGIRGWNLNQLLKQANP